MQKDDLLKYMDFILSVAIGKCGNLAEAQDLTQETMLAALCACEKNTPVTNAKGWLLQVLHHKYYDMLRRKYQKPTVVIGDGFDVADERDFLEDMLHREEHEAVRREVAFLAESYRKVILKHYFYGESVEVIARDMNIPQGTVKSRLNFGRKQIGKGLEKMTVYEENSYQPQCLNVSFYGTSGMNAEPMSLVEGDRLAQNLLILAYEKPVTIAELSKAIGVATAYVEPIVNKLVAGELMRRMGDGKVYTDFVLYHAEDFVKYIKEQEAFAKEHANAYLDAVRVAVDKLKQTDFYSLRLERYMLIHIAEKALQKSLEAHRKPVDCPLRPNGGKWIAFGIFSEEDYRIPEEKQGREEYGLAGERVSSITEYLDASYLAIHNYESSLYPYPKHMGLGYDSYIDAEYDMAQFFYIIAKGKNPQETGIDSRMMRAVHVLEERGFLSTGEGNVELWIPVLTITQERRFCEICEAAIESVATYLEKQMLTYIKTHKKKIPPHLNSVPDSKLTMPYEPKAMMFVFEAIDRGIHPRQLGYPCPETYFVYQ